MSTAIPIILLILNVYYFTILAYILMSWFPGARQTRFYGQLAMVVEPYLSRFRSVIPPIGGLDLSPLLGFLLLSGAIRLLS